MATRHSDADIGLVPASWPGPGERPLDPVRRFLNTLRIEDDVDLLANSADAVAWFTSQGYGALVVSELRLRQYRTVRDLARRAIRGDKTAVADLDELLPRLVAAAPSMTSGTSGWSGGLRAQQTKPDRQPLQLIALNLWRGAANGELARLKICADDRCQLAFYDRSRNQSRTWCTSGECGNRNRVARHRARRAG